MLKESISKLLNRSNTNATKDCIFNNLTIPEQQFLKKEIRNFNNLSLNREWLIFLQRKTFLTENAEDLIIYLVKCLERLKFKFDEVLSNEQKQIVCDYLDNIIETHGVSYIMDNHIISFEGLNHILLYKYKTKEALRKHKLEISNKLTSATCLEKYGTKRIAGNASAEHMKLMTRKNSEWQKNLSGKEAEEYWKKRSDGAKRANARRSKEEQMRINEKNRLSNIQTWNLKSEEEKESIRKRSIENGLKALNHPRMNAGSVRNNKFELSLLEKLNVEVEREFAIKYNDNHLFKYDFKIGNVLIDINPVETHNSSISFTHISGRCKDANCNKHFPESSRYHFNRWKVARDHGYELISIFDWMDSDSVIDFISYKVTKNQKAIGARKCEVRLVSKENAVEFINQHHLLGFPPTKQIYSYGLYYNDELVSLLVVCPPRYKKDLDYDYELLRFVSNMKISGGLQKLWKAFLIDKNPKSVITYTDNNIGNGFIYQTIGFELLSIEAPTMYWENLRYPQYKFQAKILARQGADIVVKNYVKRMGKEYFEVGMDFDSYVARGGKEFYNRPNDTKDNWIGNNEIAEFYGFVKIYDCGNTRWCWNK